MAISVLPSSNAFADLTAWRQQLMGGTVDAQTLLKKKQQLTSGLQSPQGFSAAAQALFGSRTMSSGTMP